MTRAKVTASMTLTLCFPSRFSNMKSALFSGFYLDEGRSLYPTLKCQAGVVKKYKFFQ